MEKQHFVPGDLILIENIVSYLKAKGIFDEFRHECIADVDTKSSCQNLSQRVDGYTTKFLSNETWNQDLNKNELRNKLRKHIDESGMLAVGADHVVEQVINPKIQQLFLPRIIEVVHQYLSEETKKLSRKQEYCNEVTNSEKLSVDNSDGISNKGKTTVLDPIADILSFTYSKPKQATPPIQNVQAKVLDISKIDKKKDENVHQAKISDVTLKVEKKKEEIVQQAKIIDNLLKLKKEESTVQVVSSDVSLNVEKNKEEIIVHPIKTEVIESINEYASPVTMSQAKSLNDTKDLNKDTKELKTDEPEACSDVQKDTQDDIKQEKKKMDNLKLQVTDGLSQSEESVTSKSLPIAPKSNSVSKNKLQLEKYKNKSFSSLKTTNKTSESNKSKTKELFDSSSAKLHKDKSKISSTKGLKSSTKDQSSPFKSNSSSKPAKTENAEDRGSKNKFEDTSSKSSDSSIQRMASSKTGSVKKEKNSIRLKHSSDKNEKHKTSISSDSKSEIKLQTESSMSETGNKSSSQYSSSYESSQGSDQDKSSASSLGSKEKQKHFSKHYKKESSSENSSEKAATPERKRTQTDSETGTSKKCKEGKVSKYNIEKQGKSFSIQESAKISSRSNSFGSASSTSDSQTSSKETSQSTSEETSDTLSKHGEKKKKELSKEKEPCGGTLNLPPPSPPPPSSGLLGHGASSAEMSSMDEMQSSQESESDSEISDEEMSEISEDEVSEISEDELSSDSDVENVYGSSSIKSSDQKCVLKEPELLNDIYDIFLFSSSSSEFEGYSSSPEKTPTVKKCISDVSVSPVHTSDLSSFDEELSDIEWSSPQPEEEKIIKRFTIKKAEDLLRAKAEQQRLEALKNAPSPEGTLSSNSSLQNLTSVIYSEEEVSPPPEPKRESRRERKLNPKYASNEYTSIFNSKRTSFITKQATRREFKQPVNRDVKKIETAVQVTKDTLLHSRRTSVTNSDTNQSLCEDLKISSNSTAVVQNMLSGSSAAVSKECDPATSEFISEESSLNSDIKANMNAHDKNHNTLAETDSQNRLALKVKKSASKNDNETNKDPNSHSLKRKFEDDEKLSAKRTCRRNSINSCSSESVANENKPFNNKTNNSSIVLTIEQTNSKDFFHKQKVNNNGDVLNKIEHVRKNPHSKPNHVTEKQTGD